LQETTIKKQTRKEKKQPKKKGKNTMERILVLSMGEGGGEF
jgi:hypothetical protein